MRYVNGTRLDDRIVRVDWDAGFVEGRQFGRGKSGGQVRDEYRQDFDGGELKLSYRFLALLKSSFFQDVAATEKSSTTQKLINLFKCRVK